MKLVKTYEIAHNDNHFIRIMEIADKYDDLANQGVPGAWDTFLALNDLDRILSADPSVNFKSLYATKEEIIKAFAE